MMKYIFRDTDVTGYGEYDIEGTKYSHLLSTCFLHSATVAFRIAEQLQGNLLLKQLEQYRLPLESYVLDAYAHYGNSDKSMYQIHHYYLCVESQKIIRCLSSSLFGWIYGWGYKNPEDPVFFRADGSVFLSSITHEGECVIAPREGEDIRSIISEEAWLVVDA